MALTLIIVSAATLAFKDATQVNHTITLQSDMSDNLRAGLNMMVQDLILTGSGIPTGGIPIPNKPNSTTTPTCSTIPAPNRPSLNAGATFPACNFVLPSIEPGNQLGPFITAPDANQGLPSNSSSYTDEITILYADNTINLASVPINQPTGTTAGCPNGSINVAGDTATFDSTCINLTTLSNSGLQIQPGDLILFSNSIGNAIQTVTSVSGQTLSFASGDAFGFNGRTDATQGTIKSIENSGCTTSANCWPTTTLTRIWMISYYLDNVTDPTHVRLIRRVNFNTGTPVGETIENLQFTYNFIDGVTNPANQAVIPSANTEAQIRSVNIYLGARSNYPINQGTSSHYARNNLSTQVSLRSMAYVNRYQ